MASKAMFFFVVSIGQWGSMGVSQSVYRPVTVAMEIL